jgi:Flp pilus assembly CpaF family ATPase
MNSAVQQHELRQATNLSRLATPLLPLLKEAATLDIVVNRDESIWVNRLGRGFERTGDFSVHESTLLLQGIATIRRIAFNHDQPILETIFPLTGDRIEGLISPVVDGAVLAIRTRQKQIFTLDEMSESGILSNKADPLTRGGIMTTSWTECKAAITSVSFGSQRSIAETFCSLALQVRVKRHSRTASLQNGRMSRRTIG